MTPEEVLDRAADLIEERGWARGDYETTEGCLCAVGAIRTVVCGTTEFHLVEDVQTRTLVVDAQNLLVRRIGASRPDAWGDQRRPPTIPFWNDDYAHGAEEVVAVMRGLGQPDPAGAAPLD